MAPLAPDAAADRLAALPLNDCVPLTVTEPLLKAVDVMLMPPVAETDPPPEILSDEPLMANAPVELMLPALVSVVNVLVAPPIP